ncbi:MAG: pro-sigmaK processing inhibitor BofA family protein [Bacillota bacterium]
MSVMMFAGILAAVLFGVFMVLGKGPVRSLVLVASNFVLGFGSLYLVNFCSGITGFAIPINIPTLVSSGALGFAGTLLNGAVVAFAGF